MFLVKLWWLVVVALLWAGPAWASFNEPVGCTGLPALTGDTTTSVGSCATTDNLHKISTQTVAAGASIAFTGLSTYNSYRLMCSGLFPATNATSIFLQIGEGGTPTWNTSNYTWELTYMFSSGTMPLGLAGTSATGVIVANTAANSIAGSTSFSLDIRNFTLATAYKLVSGLHEELVSGVDTYMWAFGGAYIGSTNAATAIRLIAATGNVSGTCTLYGYVQ